MNTYVIAFESTHAAMATERALKPLAKITMLPTPKAISAGCGMSIKFEATDDAEAVSLAGNSPDAKGMAALFRQEGETYVKAADV